MMLNLSLDQLFCWMTLQFPPPPQDSYVAAPYSATLRRHSGIIKMKNGLFHAVVRLQSKILPGQTSPETIFYVWYDLMKDNEVVNLLHGVCNDYHSGVCKIFAHTCHPYA